MCIGVGSEKLEIVRQRTDSSYGEEIGVKEMGDRNKRLRETENKGESMMELMKTIRLEISLAPFSSCLIDAIPIYFLWNWLAPVIFEVPEITFWQAWGVSFLASVLLRGFAVFKLKVRSCEQVGRD